MKVEINKYSILIKNKFNRFILKDIKRLLVKKKYDKENYCWEVEKDISNIYGLSALIEEYGFNIISDPEDEFYKKLQLAQLIYNDMFLELTPEQKSFLKQNLKLTLRHYQEQEVAYMYLTRKCVNGGEVGTGKTCETIATSILINEFPIIVVCPSYLKLNWKKEFEMWTNLSIQLITKAKDEINDSNVVIMSYDIFRKFDLNMMSERFKTMICDESHYCKNSSNLRSKAVKKVAKKLNNVFLLSGTIVENRPIEAWNQFEILSVEEAFVNWFRYAYRYCGAKKTEHGLEVKYATNTQELHYIMRSLFYTRRNKKEVFEQLPQKQFSRVVVELTNRSKYLKADKDFLAYVFEEYGLERLEKAERAPTLTMITELKKLALQGKLRDIKDYLDDFIEETDEKFIIMSTMTEGIDFFCSMYGFDKVDGSTSDKDKFEAVERFQRGEVRGICGNTESLGTGWTLTEASYIFFLDLHLNPAKLEQAVGRIDRFGQKQMKLNIVIFSALGSIDEKIYDIVMSKYNIISSVNKGEEVNFEDNVVDELMDTYLKLK